MRILVCGGSGQVGQELVRRAAGFGLRAPGLTDRQLDITRPAQIDQALRQSRAGLIINAAAYTHVDKAETDVEQAYAVNLADAARRAGIPLLHISTDYVFSGEAGEPYRETDAPAPCSVYGASKQAGESIIQARLEQHLILRTGVYGHNFVKTMLRLGRTHATLSVVNDQFGCPTWAGGIADVLLVLASRYARKGSLDWGCIITALARPARGIPSRWRFSGRRKPVACWTESRR